MALCRKSARITPESDDSDGGQAGFLSEIVLMISRPRSTVRRRSNCLAASCSNSPFVIPAYPTNLLMPPLCRPFDFGVRLSTVGLFHVRARESIIEKRWLWRMNPSPQHRMTVDEYFTWAARRPGRYELINGAVYEMSPETAGHAKTKAAVYVALMTAVRRHRLPCHALPDGMTV